MLDEFSRSRLLLGSAAMERLSRAKVAVFGLGGVGGHAADALVRTGVGSFVLVDADRVSLTNLNRQLIADHAAIGRLKTEVMREHMLLVGSEDDALGIITREDMIEELLGDVDDKYDLTPVTSLPTPEPEDPEEEVDL